MNFNRDKQNILKYIGKPMTKKSDEGFPLVNDLDYDIFNEAWAIAIVIDVREFKKMEKYYKRSNFIRIIQAYSNSVINVSKELSSFVDAYLNENEIRIILRADSKENISDAYDVIITINSIVNYLMPKLLKENGLKKEFKAGIGVWLSKNNSLIKYRENENMKYGFFTTIGDSVNYASILAKQANHNGSHQIMFNGTLHANMEGKGATAFAKWAERLETIDDKEIWGYSIRWKSYAD